MGLWPILFITHTVTIGTMLNFNDSNSGHGLKNVTCKQTLHDVRLGNYYGQERNPYRVMQSLTMSKTSILQLQINILK